MRLVDARRDHRLPRAARRWCRFRAGRGSGPVARPVRAGRLRQDRCAGRRGDADLRRAFGGLLARRGLRNARARPRRGRPRGGAAGVRGNPRLGRFLGRPRRYHPARAGRATARAAPRGRDGRDRARRGRTVRGTWHRNGGRRSGRADSVEPGPGGGVVGRRARLGQSEHRAHQSSCRSRWGGQSRAERVLRTATADHRLRDAASGAGRDSAGAVGGGALAGGPPVRRGECDGVRRHQHPRRAGLSGADPTGAVVGGGSADSGIRRHRGQRTGPRLRRFPCAPIRGWTVTGSTEQPCCPPSSGWKPWRRPLPWSLVGP